MQPPLEMKKHRKRCFFISLPGRYALIRNANKRADNIHRIQSRLKPADGKNEQAT